MSMILLPPLLPLEFLLCVNRCLTLYVCRRGVFDAQVSLIRHLIDEKNRVEAEMQSQIEKLQNVYQGYARDLGMVAAFRAKQLR